MAASPRQPVGALRPAMVVVAASALALTGCGSPVGYRTAASTENAARLHDHCPRFKHPLTTKEEDWKSVTKILGRTGSLRDDVVYGISLPRRDLKVTVRGVVVTPSLALNGSADFVRYCDGTMLMGDLVLTEDEVPKVTDAFQEAGFQQTAIHKHLPHHTPAIWWTHFHAMGDPETLARRLKDVLAFTATPPAPPPPPNSKPIDLDTEAIDRALGRKGIAEGRTYKFFISRRETITAHDHVLPAPLGFNTVIKFQALGGRRAAVNGDIIMTANEVQSVIRALRKGGIYPVELHNHTLDEHPRLFYLHYWATGDGAALAKALRPALNATNLLPAPAPTGNGGSAQPGPEPSKSHTGRPEPAPSKGHSAQSGPSESESAHSDPEPSQDDSGQSESGPSESGPSESESAHSDPESSQDDSGQSESGPSQNDSSPSGRNEEGDADGS